MSTTALSTKRDRRDTPVAAALGRDAARRAAPVVPALRANQSGGCLALPARSLMGICGRPRAASPGVAGTWAAPLPGQALVVLAQHHMVITDVIRNAEGPPSAAGLPGGVPRVRAGDLWSADAL